MNLLYVSLICLLQFIPSESVKCADTECPVGSSSCNVKYSRTSASKDTIANVTCYDNSGNIAQSISYPSRTKQLDLPVPVIRCGTLLCKSGSHSCSSSTETSYIVNQSKKVTYLTCYDGEGNVFDTQVVNHPVSLLPPSIKIPTLVCDGFQCPESSGRCVSESTLKATPALTKKTSVKCYDFANELLAEVEV